MSQAGPMSVGVPVVPRHWHQTLAISLPRLPVLWCLESSQRVGQNETSGRLEVQSGACMRGWYMVDVVLLVEGWREGHAGGGVFEGRLEHQKGMGTVSRVGTARKAVRCCVLWLGRRPEPDAGGAEVRMSCRRGTEGCVKEQWKGRAWRACLHPPTESVLEVVCVPETHGRW